MGQPEEDGGHGGGADRVSQAEEGEERVRWEEDQRDGEQAQQDQGGKVPRPAAGEGGAGQGGEEREQEEVQGAGEEGEGGEREEAGGEEAEELLEHVRGCGVWNQQVQQPGQQWQWLRWLYVELSVVWFRCCW